MKNQALLTNEELSSFCSQISTLLHAGITPLEGLRILLSDSTDPGSKKLLQDIIDGIASGMSFTESLDSVHVFPDYVINTLALGEEAGSLDDVMHSLAIYYEREAQISESIKSALTYPLVMIAMMILVIIILITKVLPIFNQVFVQLGSEMTGFGASLMSLGITLNTYSVVFVGILVFIFLLWLFLAKIPVGKRIAAGIFANSVFTRKFYEAIATGRFASGMSLALSAGLDTYSSLDMVRKLVENKKIQEKIDTCKNNLIEGESFADAMKSAELFSNVNNRMLAVGFQTGEIDKVMREIADQYEAKVQRRISDIVSVIEPTLVIILSLIVGLILLSVILPLMGIMSVIG